MDELNPISVIAIGGHALLDPDRPPTVSNQFEVTERAMKPVAALIAAGEQVVITHGNGPQVGFMQLRSDVAQDVLHRVPLDSLVADSQGSLGYMLQRALRTRLQKLGLEREVVSVVTEVEVDPHDTSFSEPTKPIGLFYKEDEARKLAAKHRWDMAISESGGFRRVVPSPAPVRIIQLEIVRRLVRGGVVAVCCGGGGIPVICGGPGLVEGVQAVIDKDRTSALLAVGLRATNLVITTAADAVYRNYQTPDQERLACLSVSDVKEMFDEGQFPAGSMAPKMEAALYYLERVPGRVVVCHPRDVQAALAGAAGTIIQ